MRVYEKGYTFIELLVALAIMSLVFASLGFSFHTGFHAHSRIEQGLVDQRAKDVFFKQISHELSNSFPYAKAPFVASETRLAFPAFLQVYHAGSREDVVVHIEYKIVENRLTRTETRMNGRTFKKTLKETEIVFEDLSDARFEFLTLTDDGLAWTKEWTNDPYLGLPKGVRLYFRGGPFGKDGEIRQVLISQGVLRREIL